MARRRWLPRAKPLEWAPAAVVAAILRTPCADFFTPRNRFFPTPGQLRELGWYNLVERARIARGAEYLIGIMATTDQEPSSPECANLIAANDRADARWHSIFAVRAKESFVS